MKFYKAFLQKMAAKHLRKFEQNFAKYEELFEEWKENEDNRFSELEQYILDLGESLDKNQVNRLMKTSNTFKGLAEDLVPKFLQIVERLVELSQQFSEYEPGEPNRYKCLAVEAKRSFDGQIEDLLDFSDYYRGLARAHDPNNKVVKVFDDVDSLFEYIETV